MWHVLTVCCVVMTWIGCHGHAEDSKSVAPDPMLLLRGIAHDGSRFTALLGNNALENYHGSRKLTS